MVSYSEKERLLRAFRDEPAYGLGVVVKCAAGLLIVAGLAVIGTTAESPSQPAAVASARSTATETQEPVRASHPEAAHEDHPETPGRR